MTPPREAVEIGLSLELHKRATPKALHTLAQGHGIPRTLGNESPKIDFNPERVAQDLRAIPVEPLQGSFVF